jgi:glycosyltransferase involved in cell wall biosynthesis
MLYGLFNDSFPPVTDGVAQTVLNYAHWINETKNDNSCVVTPQHNGIDESKYNFNITQFPSFPLPLRDDYMVGMPLISFSAMKALKEMPISLVHAHSPFSAGTMALKTSKMKNIPLIATFHSKFDDDFATVTGIPATGKVAAKYVNHFYSQADEVWAVNKGTAKTLYDYGFEGHIEIMPNGCDMPATCKSKEITAKIKNKYHLLESGKTLCFVGRLTPQKNPQFILDTVLFLKNKGIDINAIIVGDGCKYDSLSSFIAENNLSDRVVMTGKITDRKLLRDIYTASDLFVLPSIYDNAPLVIREAAACQCPSLLISNSNSAEGIIDQVNGFLTECTSRDVSEYIEYLAGHPEILEAAGKNAQKTVYVSWENIVNKAICRYEEVIALYLAGQTRNSQKTSKMSFFQVQRLKKAIQLRND